MAKDSVPEEAFFGEETGTFGFEPEGAGTDLNHVLFPGGDPANPDLHPEGTLADRSYVHLDDQVAAMAATPVFNGDEGEPIPYDDDKYQ